jgi:hypothetical protein
VLNETYEDIPGAVIKERRFKLAVSAASPLNTYAEKGVSRVDLTGVRPAKVNKIDDGELGDIKYWSNPETWNFTHGLIP